MNAKDYFQLPGVSSHMLIEMQRSPLHCWAKYLNPKREPETPTAAQLLGTLTHTLTLTPEQFDDDFALAESVNRRSKAGKAKFAKLLKAGKLLVAKKDFQTALRATKAVRQHPDARALLEGGEPEKIITVPRGTGLLPLKGRLDWLGQPPSIAELKTATDARKESFLRDVYRYGYHLSAAFYRMLASEHTGTAPEKIPHTFVVVETRPPHAVAVYHTSERLLAQGRTLWETQLARFDECWLEQKWPGYPLEVLEPDGGGRTLRFDVEEGEVEL